MDSISIARINLLHPLLRQDAVAVLAEAERALTGRAFLRVASTLRTMEEQTALYRQGRSTPGKKVTNAKAGQSIHNYGLALDIVLVVDGKVASWDVKMDWDGDKQSDWMEVVNIFKRHGWSWGGDWRTFKDMPHFEKTFGYAWDRLKIWYDAKKHDKDGYVYIPDHPHTAPGQS